MTVDNGTRAEATYVVANIIKAGPEVVVDRILNERNDLIQNILNAFRHSSSNEHLTGGLIVSLKRLAQLGSKKEFLSQFLLADGKSRLYEIAKHPSSKIYKGVSELIIYIERMSI